MYDVPSLEIFKHFFFVFSSKRNVKGNYISPSHNSLSNSYFFPTHEKDANQLSRNSRNIKNLVGTKPIW